ncbi:MAG TPA: hypothetical protein VFN19_07645, partial [Candidatus Nanopelagicales bacterium]|nr:hypothetical protein [Candidatus Nanopelagicales bacterium]
MAQDEVDTTPRPTGSGRIALAALGGGMSVILLAGGAMAIAGAASADNADPTPAPAAPQAPPAPGGPGALLGGMGLAGLGGGIGSAGVPLHGTAVVKTADGTYQTLAGQHGEVTAV